METLMVDTVDVLDPRPEQIDIDEMLYKLARVVRWNGSGYLSVLQHMMHVARLLHDEGASTATKLAGMTHDLHEYVTGDIPAPLLDTLWLDDGKAMRKVVDVQAHIPAAIVERMGLSLEGADMAAVDRADHLARVQELALKAHDPDKYPSWLLTKIAYLTLDAVVPMYRRGLAQLGVTL